jgi:hypothetical protein
LPYSLAAKGLVDQYGKACEKKQGYSENHGDEDFPAA